ncbi:Regucalcin [Acropora cervicornis]|uniref:Regucalcin n=1 Tax=Acropora cervicornis TaxID=6130 RepID=A0AAD9UWL3_ACRCE|nr:Regucalcin [Acropora cervicornis]
MAALKCEISVVKECCAQLGEGPHWDESSQRLIWVDIFGRSVHLLDPVTGKDEKYNFDGAVGAAVPRRKGGSLVVAAERDFIFLDLETGKQEIVASVDGDKPGNRFNDGKCDPAGRFWAGTMGPEPIPTQVVPNQGSLVSISHDDMSRELFIWKTEHEKMLLTEVITSEPYQFKAGTKERGSTWTEIAERLAGCGLKYSLNCDHTVQSHVDKISISNGIAWDTDKKIFYHADTAERKIDAFDYDKTSGALFNRRTVINVDPALGIVRYDPDTGKSQSYVDLPVRITTSARLTDEEKQEQPLAGSIFRIRNLGTNGLPPVAFNG